MRRAIRWTVQLALTVLVTVFLLRALRLSWADLRTLDWSRWGPSPLPLTLSVALLLGTFLYLVALWARLLERLGAGRLPFGRAVQIFFLALLARYVPGKVWQLAGLTYLASRQGLAPAPTAAAAVLSQAFSLGAAVLFGSAYLGVGPTGSWLGAAAVAAAAVLGALLLFSHPRAQRAAFRWLGAGTNASAAGAGAAGAAASAVGPAFTLKWLGLHALAWAGYAASFCLLWAAFRPLPAANLWLAAAAFPAAYVLGYAAFFAPAGLGVREGALAALTAPVLGPADATALAVLARIWMTGAELLPLLWVGVAAARGGAPREGLR